MNNKDNKIADNRIEKSKKKIAQIDESIDIEKNKLKKIDNIQEEFVSLNKSINRCIELLSPSIKGTKTNHMLDEMFNNNNNLLKNVSSVLDEEKEETKKNISELYYQKTETQEKLKKEE